jgi:hypothetical protein
MAEEKVDDGARSFARFVQMIDDGVAEAEASDDLADLVKVLEAHAEDNGQAKGQITLVIDMTVNRNGRTDVKHEIKMKKPKKPRAGSVFWVTKTGNLSNKHPRQLKLGLEEVKGRKRDDDSAAQGG